MARQVELGKASSGARGVLPVLSDGAVIATLEPSTWKNTATALVGEREWVFAKRRRELTGRWAVDPEDTVRFRARQTSRWRNTWEIVLDGVALRAETSSRWRSTHRFVSDGAAVAESGSTGGWAPRRTMTGDDTIPLDQLVFLLWLELIISRGNTAAMTAVLAGGAVAGGS